MRIRENSCWALTTLMFLVAVPWAGATPPETFQDLMEQGRQAQVAGKLDEAADLYRSVLRMRPHWGPAEYDLGLIASVRKDFSEAVQLFAAALHDDPSLTDAYLFRGIALFNLQQPGQALPSLERFYRLRPGDPQIRFYLAGTYNALGNYPAAAQLYAEQLDLTPTRPELYYFLGECLLNLSRQESAALIAQPQGKYFLWMIYAQEVAEKGGIAAGEGNFREAIKLNPANPSAYVHLGNLFLGAGKAEEAKNQFEEALRRDPQNCAALEGIGDLDLVRNDIPVSVAEYSKVAAASPPCIEEPVPLNLGLSPTEFRARLKTLAEYAEKGRPGAGFELARFRTQEASGKFEATTNSGEGAEHKGEAPSGEANACYSALPRGSPQALTSYQQIYLANCLESHGQHRVALKALSALESRSDGSAEATYRVFRIHMRLAQSVFLGLESLAPGSYLVSEIEAESLELKGNMGDAEKAYRAAMASSGSDPTSFIEYGRFKCRRNEPDDAIAVLKEALVRAPYNIRANDLMGEALFMKSDYATAIPYLQNVIRAEPGNEDGRIRLAQSLAKVNQLNDAVVILEAAPSDADGRIHYVLAGYYRREGRKDDTQRALAFFEERQRTVKTKAFERMTKDIPLTNATNANELPADSRHPESPTASSPESQQEHKN